MWEISLQPDVAFWLHAPLSIEIIIYTPLTPYSAHLLKIQESRSSVLFLCLSHNLYWVRTSGIIFNHIFITLVPWKFFLLTTTSFVSDYSVLIHPSAGCPYVTLTLAWHDVEGSVFNIWQWTKWMNDSSDLKQLVEHLWEISCESHIWRCD